MRGVFFFLFFFFFIIIFAQLGFTSYPVPINQKYAYKLIFLCNFCSIEKPSEYSQVSVDEIPSSEPRTTAGSYTEFLEMWSHVVVTIRIYRDTVVNYLTSMIMLYCKMITYIMAETSNYLPISISPFFLSNFTLWFLAGFMAPHHRDSFPNTHHIDVAMWLNSDQWTIQKLRMQL